MQHLDTAMSAAGLYARPNALLAAARAAGKPMPKGYDSGAAYPGGSPMYGAPRVIHFYRGQLTELRTFAKDHAPELIDPEKRKPTSGPEAVNWIGAEW